MPSELKVGGSREGGSPAAWAIGSPFRRVGPGNAASPATSRARPSIRRPRIYRAYPCPVRRIAEEAHGRDLIVSAQDRLGQDRRLRPRHRARTPRRRHGAHSRGLPLRWSSPRRASSRCRSARSFNGSTPAGPRVVTCVGGMDPMKERRALSGGAHIVVGTPGPPSRPSRTRRARSFVAACRRAR